MTLQSHHRSASLGQTDQKGTHSQRTVACILALLIAFSSSFAAGARPSSHLIPQGLRCEYVLKPIAVDNACPRLSWQLRSPERAAAQTAYQIVVATSRQLMDRDHGDLWDSGKILTNQSLDIAYQGKPLKSSQQVFWKVRVWDRAGCMSAWSQAATWTMGLLAEADWQAQWLSDGKSNPERDADFYKEDPAPLFRKEFAIRKRISRARLYICGLGYYEATLNGQPVGDQVLDPGWTQYSERALYSTHDVTGQLRRGANCLGVTLGNGWYNPLPLRMWGRLNLREHLSTGRPRFIARLEIEYKDGTCEAVVSDSSWKVTDGPLRFNSIYLGEIYDARREVVGWDCAGFDDSGWQRPGFAIEPVGHLRAQTQPPIRVTRSLKAVNLTEPKPGVFIFDFGQNFAGWANVKLSAPAGTKVRLRHGELLNSDGTLNPMTSVAGQIKGTRKSPEGRVESVGGPGAPPVAWQSDTYVSKGMGRESYMPRFTFRAFRYVEITGLPGKPSLRDVTGHRLNADVEPAGWFHCSNKHLNRIQEICDWTFLSNLFSVQSDCPHRERFAYGGDIVATSEAFMMNYDMSGFYAKTVRDWADAARPDGRFSDTAPFVGIDYCGIGWAMVHPLLLEQLYQHYGNRSLLEEQVPAAIRWLEGEAGRREDGLVTKGLGDHEALAKSGGAVLTTPMFIDSARRIARLARLIGRAGDAGRCETMADESAAAWAHAFLVSPNGNVGSGSQSEQTLALGFGAAPDAVRPAVFASMVESLTAPADGPRLTTGIFGTRFLLEELSTGGRSDLAYALADRKTFPSWGWMLESNATTLWENWAGSDNTFSQNHPMFGSVSTWFFRWLGGIQSARDAVGFDRIILRPQAVKDLDWVRCRYHSVRGEISSNWRWVANRLRLEVVIPANTTASVYLPASDVRQVQESGRAVENAPGVFSVLTDSGNVIVGIGSGRYVFDVSK